MTVILRTLFLVFLIVLSTAVRSQDDNTVFTLVRDVSELKEGDVLVIVNKVAGVALSTEASSSVSIAPVSVEIAGDDVIVNEKVQFFYLKGSSSAWRFFTGSQYLTTTSNAALFLQETLTDYTKTKITIDSNTGEAVIDFLKSGEVGYNSDRGIFKCYESSLPNNGEVCLYKGSAIPHFPTSLILNGDTQDADNSDAITSYLNTTVDQVTLQRTFVGDGGWYTLCLPFALTADDIATQFQGADFQEFTGVTMNADNTFNLEFRSVSQTRAGVPYLVRPIKDTEIINPVFTDKLISEAKPVTVVHALQTEPLSEYSFTGIYNSTDLFIVDPSANQTIRFVNADGTQLVRPINDGTKLKATRAYVKLPSADTKAMIRHHEGETDGIQHTTSDSQSAHAGVYDLGGRYVGPSAEGLERGVYIVDGRKIMIK